ncbi:hypothetical protein NE237_010353 [Protea cynaroides]|uniref:Uncharacterized protein n=1 Tax=Protea cynaroides TaxID=273540 RepID=A0A9Q0R164_9MAGN|nr:hypothetical protein NE237_010353 [Protea cynaroides]
MICGSNHYHRMLSTALERLRGVQESERLMVAIQTERDAAITAKTEMEGQLKVADEKLLEAEESLALPVASSSVPAPTEVVFSSLPDPPEVALSSLPAPPEVAPSEVSSSSLPTPPEVPSSSLSAPLEVPSSSLLALPEVPSSSTPALSNILDVPSVDVLPSEG